MFPLVEEECDITKFLDTPEEDCQVLGFVNPVVESDDEDDDIFEPERNYSDVFTTFVSKEKIKMCFKFVFISSQVFTEFPKMLEIHSHKKFIFQHCREIKVSRNIVFRSNREIKMARKCSISAEPRN